MKQSTIKDLRTTLIVLLVSILSSASALYVLPTVIAPVHAGFSNPSWTTNPTPVPVGTPFSVQVNVPAGQSVTYITVLFYNSQNKLVGNANPPVPPTSFTIASNPALIPNAAGAATSLLLWPAAAV